jgi:hypothetical protein
MLVWSPGFTVLPTNRSTQGLCQGDRGAMSLGTNPAESTTSIADEVSATQCRNDREKSAGRAADSKSSGMPVGGGIPCSVQ